MMEEFAPLLVLVDHHTGGVKIVSEDVPESDDDSYDDDDGNLLGYMPDVDNPADAKLKDTILRLQRDQQPSDDKASPVESLMEATPAGSIVHAEDRWAKQAPRPGSFAANCSADSAPTISRPSAPNNSTMSRIYGNNSEHFLVHAEDPPGNKKDYDWVTKCASDDGKWIFWSTKRLHLMREVLTTGIPVQYRSSGTSLAPLVNSNDICYIYPIKYDDEIEAGDIVFCSVQGGDRLYVHLDWAKIHRGRLLRSRPPSIPHWKQQIRCS